MNILLLNAGSSSLKAVLTESAGGAVHAHGSADWAGSATRYHFAGEDGKERSETVPWRGHAKAVAHFIADLTTAQRSTLSGAEGIVRDSRRAVHVHVRPDHEPKFVTQIMALADLAPLHNPPSLETIAAAEAELSNVPHVAVFDTALLPTLAPVLSPIRCQRRPDARWGIRRWVPRAESFLLRGRAVECSPLALVPRPLAW